MDDPCCVRFGLSFREHVFRVLYLFDYRPELSPDVRAWMDDNAITLVSLTYDPTAQYDTCLIARFAHPNDALAFTLRWL